MKEIIIKIFATGWFPIFLFTSIGVLLILFIITLILAINDAKKSAIKPTNTSDNGVENIEKEQNEVVTITSSDEKLESVNEQPTFEDFKFDDKVESEEKKEPIEVPMVKKSSKSKEPVEVIIPQLDNYSSEQSNEENSNTKDNSIDLSSIFKVPSNIKINEISKEAENDTVKVVDSSPVINVKSFDSIENEEYNIK